MPSNPIYAQLATRVYAAQDENRTPVPAGWTGEQWITASTEQTAQNINFRENTFVQAFSDNPAISAEAAALPQMLGGGLAREIWVDRQRQINVQNMIKMAMK